MNGVNYASLVNLVGFALGIALYAMLLAMTLARPLSSSERTNRFAPNTVLTVTALLGLFWNFGELFSYVWQDFFSRGVPPIFSAVSFSALGFLPAVVVHSNLTDGESRDRRRGIIVGIAYIASFGAALMHFITAFSFGKSPSVTALQTLTAVYVIILSLLFIFNLRQTIERKAVWATALAIFAASALHLSGSHTREDYSVLIEIVGHQASLPLVLAILLQNYRFAFADIFLKRALSLFFLALTAVLIYVTVAVPLLRLHETHGETDAQTIAVLLLCWIATALIFPFLQKASRYLVDKILLKRPDYGEVRREIERNVEKSEDVETILDDVRRRLELTLTARRSFWSERKSVENFLRKTVEISSEHAKIILPTQDAPYFEMTFADFYGGRRLFSDDDELLQNVALLTARRIDAVRFAKERLEGEMREQNIAKLAGEAELRALRAQLNPHFLFNALTTIGYLIQSAPERALQTLMQLTKLLRGVLRSNGEFVALSDELDLIENYLKIEKARFEERLTIEIEVAPETRRLSIPSLIVQPLIENAVKHAVSRNKNGGKLAVKAFTDAQYLYLEVADEGAGADSAATDENFSAGVGLANIRARLQAHYGADAELSIARRENGGTRAALRLPLAEKEHKVAAVNTLLR